MLRKRAWTAGNWSSPRSGRTRVLVESSDAVEQWAFETALGDAGYDVAVCDGPSYHGAPCPLIRTGDCPLVAGADVIVNRFRLCEPANQDVLRAVRSHWPATPVAGHPGDHRGHAARARAPRRAPRWLRRHRRPPDYRRSARCHPLIDRRRPLITHVGDRRRRAFSISTAMNTVVDKASVTASWRTLSAWVPKGSWRAGT
jgi:hypothetical protein